MKALIAVSFSAMFQTLKSITLHRVISHFRAWKLCGSSVSNLHLYSTLNATHGFVSYPTVYTFFSCLLSIYPLSRPSLSIHSESSCTYSFADHLA